LEQPLADAASWEGSKTSSAGHHSASVQQVPNGQDRVPPQHPRPGITHHFADPFSQLRFITVDPAVGARRLVLPERTAGQPAYCVRLQFRALGAQFAARRVTVATEDADHRRDRRLLAGNPTGAGRDNVLTGWGLVHCWCAIILFVGGGSTLRLREEPIDVLRSIVLRISAAAGPVGVSLPDLRLDLANQDDDAQYAHLTRDDRRAIREILWDTKADLPDDWKNAGA